MTTTPITASPTKLRNGTWGATVKGTVRKGDMITIMTKSGKSWDAVVDAVVWTGNGVSIVATSSCDRPVSRGRGRGTWTGCSCGSVEEYERDSDCRSCQHDR